MKYKTPGRDLGTDVADITAEEGATYKVDDYHAAHITFPSGVRGIYLDVNSDKTPEQGIRTLTFSADPSGEQEVVTIHDPVRGDKTFNVAEKVIMTFALIRYADESYYYRIGYEYIK